MSNEITETDLDLLQQYLDGALLGIELEEVRRRLRVEPQFDEALKASRADREARRAVWQSMEPGDDEVARFIRSFTVRARKSDMVLRLGRFSRFIGAAAACIAMGFLAGWLGRGKPASGPATAGLNVASMTHANGQAPTFQVALTDDAGNVVAVQKFSRLEDAREFANDLVQWQMRRRAMSTEDPASVPVSAEF